MRYHGLVIDDEQKFAVFSINLSIFAVDILQIEYD